MLVIIIYSHTVLVYSCTCIQGLPEQVGSAVAAGIASSYQDTFRVTVLPAFERNCMEMMKQIDENFRAGTADCEYTCMYNHYNNYWLPS